MRILSIAAFFLITVILKIHETDGRVPIRKRESTNGNCIDEEGNERAVGEVWNGPDCIINSCEQDDDGEVYKYFEGCPEYHFVLGCDVIEGTGEFFPDCCPQIVCPSEESEEDEVDKEDEEEDDKEDEEEDDKKTKKN